MANMTIERHKMPAQDPIERGKNYTEVALGYTPEMAKAEAERCLNCKHKPCVKGCPVQIDIPGFVCKVADGDFDGAYEVLSAQSSLPAVCGRVCPQETQCEALCIRGVKSEPVAIGNIERFVADYHLQKTDIAVPEIEKNGRKVAIIGTGPASLTCAGDLAKAGYDVTMFEALHVPGGVLVYGIPEFRLPKAIVAQEISMLEKMGVKIERNVIIGKTVLIDELEEEGFEAVFIGSGAGLPKFMDIPGENLMGVYTANEYLTRINLMKAYKDTAETPIFRGKKIAVVGGGNVAMDAARCALRMGAEVYVTYRRSMEELPARREEVHHAQEEGVIFKTLTNPVEVLSDGSGHVAGLSCVEMELGEPDESGRRKPVVKPDSLFTLDVDCVIMALGTAPNSMIPSTTRNLESDKRGCIPVDEKGMTSRMGVYAGGDAVTGAATVILAMGAGKLAATSIDEFIKEK